MQSYLWEKPKEVFLSILSMDSQVCTSVLNIDGQDINVKLSSFSPVNPVYIFVNVRMFECMKGKYFLKMCN